MTTEEFRQQRLREVAEDYRRNGYEITIEPPSASLPDFFRGLQPDLLARRSSEHIVAEVKTRRDLRASDQTRRLADLLKDRPGWRFDLVLIEEDEILAKTKEARPLSLDLIERRLDGAEGLLVKGDRAAAVLFAWIAVEATLRAMAAANGVSLVNLSPHTAIRELVSSGVLDRETYRRLDSALQFRNQVVHGFDPSDLTDETVRGLIAIARKLMLEIETNTGLAVREDPS